MRAGLYIRVSTQEQADEGYSIGAQTERLKAYCAAKGWTVHHIYTDPGFSGSNIERPALDQMIKDVKRKKLDTVIVYKLDRLSRSQKDTLFLIEDVFLKNKVDFVSLNENFDTSTAFGRAMIGILSVFAQLEREQIKERTSMGRLERARDGYFHGGGYDPIGYDYKDGELIINEYEAMQVREVFKMFIDGLPINRIQKILQRKYTNKYGSWSNHSSVRSVLTTLIYTGKLQYLGNIFDGRHEAIIDEETFRRATKRYEEISWTRGERENKKTPFLAKHLLSGLLICGNCGGRYYGKGNYSGRGENKVYRPYYTCYSRGGSHKHMIRAEGCKNKSYAVVNLDKIITDEILKLTFEPQFLDEIIEKAQPEKPNTEVLENRIEELDKQLARIMDLYQLGTIPMDKISERVDTLNKEKVALMDEMDDPDEHVPAISRDEATNLLKSAEDILANGTIEERRKLVHSLIDYIEIVGEDILIHWAFA